MGSDIDQILTNFMEGLSNPYGLERSFQLRSERLSTGRALYSVHRQHLGFRAKRKLLQLAESLQVPADFIPDLDSLFDEAVIIHLGVDAGATHACKIYLEFPVSQPSAQNSLLFRAFKWAPQTGGQQAVTDYRIDGRYRASEFSQSLQQYYPDADLIDQKLLIDSVLQIVHHRAPELELLALNVTEHGNGRQSFDLNLYDADLSLTDLADWLNTATQLFAIPESEWRPLLAHIQHQSLGHIAGGIDRKGDAFLSLYHGLQGS